MKSLRISSFIVAVSILASVSVGQIGCGEKLADGEHCADWQCSRNHSNYCVKGFSKGASCTETSDCYLALECKNTTEGVMMCQKKPEGIKNPAIGFLGAFLAILGFGSSFVPIKKYKKYAGNGVFAQFCMCFGRFMFGLVLMLTRENQQFYADAALGGLFWSAGNAISVPIIQCVGMGLGIAIWGTTNMILGWASGNFGWWGVKQEIPDRPWLSYLSVALSFVSILAFLLVEPNYQPKEKEVEEEEDKKDEENSLIQSEKPEQRKTLSHIIGKTRARVIGVSLALIAGVLFGLCMDPAQRMMSRYEELTEDSTTKYSPFGFDYVFSFNVGAIGFSFFYLSFYHVLVAFGIRPGEHLFDEVKHEKILLPAFANGIIGSSGSAAWFLANQNLGLIVSFPIIAAGPGVISAMWGVFVFKEIKGMKNYIILIAAFLLVVASSLCSAFSSEH